MKKMKTITNSQTAISNLVTEIPYLSGGGQYVDVSLFVFIFFDLLSQFRNTLFSFNQRIFTPIFTIQQLHLISMHLFF
jgi:hypothetical protein